MANEKPKRHRGKRHGPDENKDKSKSKPSQSEQLAQPNLFPGVMSVGGTEEEQEADRKANRKLYREAWIARNELYEELFGPYTSVTPETYSAPPEDDGTDFRQKEDHLAVIAYSPDPVRPYWMYVTAGLSSPWVQAEPLEISGFGLELVIKSPKECTWAPQILRSMALYIFNHAGTLSPGVKIALNASIDPLSSSKLKNIFIWYVDDAPDCWYQLPSGGFGLFLAVGITDDELKYAESSSQYGTWCIQELLRRLSTGQVTDPDRSDVMKHEKVNEVAPSLRTFAENFPPDR